MSLHPVATPSERATAEDDEPRVAPRPLFLTVGFVGLGTGLAILVPPLAAVSVAAGAILGAATVAYGSEQLDSRPSPAGGTPHGARRSASALGPAEIDSAVLLIDAGVVHDEPTAQDATLDRRFACAWERRAAALLDGDAADRLDVLARLAGVPREQLELTSFESGVAASLCDERLGAWESTAAFCLDLASLELLAGRSATWARLDIAARGEVAGVLRLLAERCPSCLGVVDVDDVPATGGSAHALVTVSCQCCGVRIQELNVDVRHLVAERD